MLRIGICDDEPEARDGLRFALEKLLDESSEEIVYEFSKGETACHWIKEHPGELDVLFLDVEMPGLNGMETASEIRRSNTALQIVFVTGYTDYVFEGYQVQASGYLVKPVSTHELQKVLNRIRELLLQTQTDFFILRNTEGIRRFPQKDITYFYSRGRQVFLVSGDKEYAFYGKLDQAAQTLPSFIRIHQRYLVNPAHVSHMGSSFVTLGTVTLPISRSLKETATRKLALTLLGGN